MKETVIRCDRCHGLGAKELTFPVGTTGEQELTATVDLCYNCLVTGLMAWVQATSDYELAKLVVFLTPPKSGT